MNSKKLLSILLIACMLFSIMPVAAFADETTPEIWVGGVGLVSGQYLDESGNVGTTALSDDYAYYEDGVLTLKNYDYSGKGAKIWEENFLIARLNPENYLAELDLQIVYEGTNKLTEVAGDDQYYSGICTTGDLTLTAKDDSASLEVTAESGLLAAKEVTISGGTVIVKSDNSAIKAGTDLTITESTVTANGDYAIRAGIDLAIIDSTVTAVADEYALYAKNVAVSGESYVDAKITRFPGSFWAIRYAHVDSEGTFTYDGLNIQAAKDPEGELGEYKSGNSHNGYGRIVISPASGGTEPEPTPEIWVGGVGMVSGQYLDESGNVGTTALSDNYAYYNNGELTLHNYDYEGFGYKYFEAPNEYTGNGFALIHTESELTVNLEGDNSLIGEEVTNDDLISGMVCEESVTIKDSGALKIEVNGEGVWSAGDALTIESGSLDIDSKYDSLYAADGALYIKDGMVDIKSYYESLCATGDIIISGGTVNLESTNYICIYSIFNGDVKVEGGTVVAIASDTAEEDFANFAIYPYSGTFTYDDTKLDIEVSEDPSGTPTVEYEADNLTKYDYVKITPKSGTEPTKYNVWVTGTQVTSANASDVLNDSKVSYDPDSNTLTVSRDLAANGTTDAIKADTATELCIELKGNSVITSENGSAIYTSNGALINTDNNVTVCAAGGAPAVIGKLIVIANSGDVNITNTNGMVFVPANELTINSGAAVNISGSSTNPIMGAANINAKGNVGITNDKGRISTGKLTVSGADVTINGNAGDPLVSAIEITATGKVDIANTGGMVSVTANELTINSGATVNISGSSTNPIMGAANINAKGNVGITNDKGRISTGKLTVSGADVTINGNAGDPLVSAIEITATGKVDIANTGGMVSVTANELTINSGATVNISGSSTNPIMGAANINAKGNVGITNDKGRISTGKLTVSGADVTINGNAGDPLVSAIEITATGKVDIANTGGMVSVTANELTINSGATVNISGSSTNPIMGAANINAKGNIDITNDKGRISAGKLTVSGADVLLTGVPAGFDTPDSFSYENVNGAGYSVSEGESEDALSVVANKAAGETYSSDMDVNVIKITASKSSSSSGGGFSGVYNYPVVVLDNDDAVVSSSEDYAVKGEEVVITVTPDVGKAVDEVIVTDKDGKVIPVTRTGDNEYTFTMPASKVTVAVAMEDADYGLRIVMQINNKNILVNGVTKVNDVAPVIVGERTLVPIRVVTELLGGSADWDNATRTVTLKIDGKTMNMTIGKEIPGFGTSAVIMNDRTYVPVRYVMEMLGAEVEWINATRQIIIEK